MSLRIVTTDEAQSHVRAIDAWWRENRRASPELFLDELAGAFETVAQAPHLGRLYRLSPIAGTRRLLLRATRYHVYYVADEREVTVLAVWHAERGIGPELT